ncbi:MAG TPA: dethiobiotin synthase [Verrucomicrobiae bacterium]|jgi:dethiobiotin synthetase|nr:dethiobiotin synthase [Verrucomicrobiae bacterium]
MPHQIDLTSRARTLFITGTDTGVGKTLFTALLLRHLRESGCHALAMKPFCSGGRADVRLLQSLQPGELTDHEMNPYSFAEPVAPLVAREARRKKIRLGQVVAQIRKTHTKCETLLIEGAGGLMVPLGPGFTVADLIRKLRSEVVVVARNLLGTINHSLLTVGALKAIGNEPLALILMSSATRDLSSRSNQKVLADLLKPIPVMELPFLGERPLAKLNKKIAPLVRGVLGKVVRSLEPG